MLQHWMLDAWMGIGGPEARRFYQLEKPAAGFVERWQTSIPAGLLGMCTRGLQALAGQKACSPAVIGWPEAVWIMLMIAMDSCKF